MSDLLLETGAKLLMLLGALVGNKKFIIRGQDDSNPGRWDFIVVEMSGSIQEQQIWIVSIVLERGMEFVLQCQLVYKTSMRN